MSKPRVDTAPIANRYAGSRERIVEFSSPKGGGLISFRETGAGLVVEVYSQDGSVTVQVAPPRESAS